MERIHYDKSMERLGDGDFADVYRGTCDTDKGSVAVAVKEVQLQNVQPSLEGDKELEALRNLVHPNVVKLFHHEDRDIYRLYALELCDKSLEEFFDTSRYLETQAIEAKMLYQLASGLKFIHEENFLHLDIKPDNILISHPIKDDQRSIQMKWADFGLSERAENGVTVVESVTGASAYVAAEVASQRDNGTTITVTTMSDIFAAGCVLFRIVHDKHSHPFGDDEYQIPKNIIWGTLKNELNIELKEKHFAHDVICRMISQNVLGRSDTLIKIQESCTKAELDCLGLKEELNENDMNQLMELLHQDGFMPILLLWSENRSNFLVHIIKRLLTLCQPNDPDIIKGFSTLCTNYKNDRLLDIANVFVNRGFRLISDEDNDNDQSTLQKLCENYKQENLGEIIELLINQGAKLNHPGPQRRTALHSLCENYPHSNLVDIVRLMIDPNIEHRADVNVQQQDNGYTPLHCLCRYYRNDNLAQVIEILLDGGADTSKREFRDGYSALDLLRHRSERQTNGQIDLTEAIQLLQP